MNVGVVRVYAVMLGILALCLCVAAPARAAPETRREIGNITAHENGHCNPDVSGHQTNGCILACAVVAVFAPPATYFPQQEGVRFEVVKPGRTQCAVPPATPPPRSFWHDRISFLSTR